MRVDLQNPLSTILEGRTILLIEPRILVRECLTETLQQAFVAETILSAARITEWREMADSHPVPSVVVLSISERLRARAEIDEGRSVFARLATIPPVVVMADEEDPAQVVDALDGGARGFIPTNISLKVAIEAIRLVMAGGSYVPASSLLASRAGVNKHFEGGQDFSETGFFTDRQLAVIEMLREGKANKTIAHALNMRESTVKVHIRNIMRKLSASNRTQVAYLYQSMISAFTQHEKLGNNP